MEIRSDNAALRHPTSQAEAYITPPEPDPEVIEVLVLDDSKFDAMYIQRECKRTDLPVRVSIAPDIEHFRQMVSQKDYHLIFIDYMLPDGDGLGAQKMLGEVGRNENAPVVMISGEARHDVAVEAMRTGCVDYKAKTELTPDALRQLILKALEAGSRLTEQKLEKALGVHRDEMVTTIRSVLREELGAAPQAYRGTDGVVREVLQGYGLLPDIDGDDWGEILRDPVANFVFRKH